MLANGSIASASTASAVSNDTAKVLKGIYEEIGMPTVRQRILQEFLDEEDGDFQEGEKEIKAVKKSTSSCTKRAVNIATMPKLRKKEAIIESGAYCRDSGAPLLNGKGSLKSKRSKCHNNR